MSQSPAVTLVSGPMQNSFVQSVVVTSCLQMKFEIKAKGSVTKYVGQVFCFFRPPTPLRLHFLPYER